MHRRSPTRHSPTRQEGFPGQQISVLALYGIQDAESAVIDGLLPTACGYFPRAQGHFVQRETGIPDAVFLLCIEGAGWLSVDGKHSALQRGDVGYLPTGVPHSYGAEADTPWSLAWFHARGSRVHAAAEELGLGRQTHRVRIGDLDSDLPLIDEVCQLLRPPQQPGALRLASTLIRQWFARAAMRIPNVGHEPDLIERIEQSVRWMRANMDRPIRLAELAGRARLSKSRYTEVFGRLYGKPPIDYCTSCRIGLAAERLVTTRLRITEIAGQVGYADPLHFSRVFKREMGLSPRAYRKAEGVKKT